MRYPAPRALVFGACLFALLFAPGANVTAAPLDSGTLEFLKKNCFDCHDSGMSEGGLDLEALSAGTFTGAAFERWVKVHDRVENGEMPPAKKETAE